MTNSTLIGVGTTNTTPGSVVTLVVQSCSIQATGTMVTSLLGTGVFDILQNGIVTASIHANFGGFGSGAPQNGNYKVNHYRNRDPQHEYSSGMNKNGVGFSFDLIPTFITGRTDLRIHPDGNNIGTLGCIGLSGTGAELSLIKDKLKNALLIQAFIPCNINIAGNPNHSSSPSGNQPSE